MTKEISMCSSLLTWLSHYIPTGNTRKSQFFLVKSHDIAILVDWIHVFVNHIKNQHAMPHPGQTWHPGPSRSPLKIGTKRFWKSTPSCGFRESRVESLRSQARCGKRVTRKAVKPGGHAAGVELMASLTLFVANCWRYLYIYNMI